jgi:hypothetical protein
MKVKKLNKLQVGLSILLIISFLLSLLFLFLGLLVPIRPHFWNPELIDDECVLFVSVSCMLSVMLLSISWMVALFGKFIFFKKRKFIFVLFLILMICLLRIFYVLPHLRG